MVQYHALGVLYHIKQKDRIAVSKLVISQMKSASLRSPYATCLLIRYVSKVMETESDNATMSVFWPACGTYIGVHFHLIWSVHCRSRCPPPPLRKKKAQVCAHQPVHCPGHGGPAFSLSPPPLFSPSRRLFAFFPSPLLPRFAH